MSKDDNQKFNPQANRTSPGGGQEIKWKVVAETAGLAPAEIIAGRLQSEDIPARAWQEGAGQAFGLTIGLLGTGFVVVPEEYVDRAKEILDAEDDFDAYEEYDE
jgi:hypothetical protein